MLTVIEQEPNNAMHFNLLGYIYIKLQNPQKAKIFFLKAYELNSEVPEICNNLGNIILQIDQNYLVAAEYFSKAIKLKPNFVDAYNNLATAMLKLSNMKKAIHIIEIALQIKPNYILALNNYGKMLFFLMQSNKAKEIFHKVLTIDENNSEALSYLGEIYCEKYQYDLGIDFLNKSLSISHDFNIYYKLGYIYLDQKKYELAEKNLKKYLENDPQSLMAIGKLCYCYLSIGRWQSLSKYKNDAVKIIKNKKQFSPALPFYSHLIFHDAELQLINNKKWCEVLSKNIEQHKFTFKNSPGKKIKVGYISPHFSIHPVGILLDGLFKYHNKERFTTYCIATVAHETEIYQNISQSCDYVVERTIETPFEFAQKIYSLNLDILVDFAGDTTELNFHILKYQPTRIQCHLLGCICT
ncbi:MAG: tetratricopeptide repeat protein, partial [Romboutsia sp.]|nr:tetratricopeptide repeat protein [Romboutsia sp.]